MSHATPSQEAPALTPEQVRMQRILKFVVAGLGLLIVVVLGAMVTMMVSGGRKGHDVPAAENVTAAPFSYDLNIPARAMVIETRVDGSTLLLRLSTADGAEEIMVVDMPTGEVKGRIRLRQTE